MFRIFIFIYYKSFTPLTYLSDFDIEFKNSLTYAFICAQSVVDENLKAAFMKETIF